MSGPAGHNIYGFNERGSAVIHLDETGVYRGRWRGDAWGKTVAWQGYTGGPYSGMGARYGYYKEIGTDPEYYLCTFRHYDSSSGRWLTRDPIGYEGGVNLYAYCANNPIMEVDPLGLDACAGYANGVANKNDIPAFRSRAEKLKGGKVFTFDGSDTLIGALQKMSNITQIDLHGHGVRGQFRTGFYDTRIYVIVFFK